MSRRLLAIAPVDHPGGAEIHLLRLLAGLSRRGWEIAVTTPGTGPLRDEALRAGYTWRALALGGLRRRAGARALASWPAVRTLARRADVVYLNGTVCGRLLPALPAAAATRVLHVHDLVTRVPRFWRRADVVLADSGAVAERLAGLDAHVVYGPVDPNPPPAPSPWPTGNRPVIGFVGRIEPRKGPLDLVRATPAIRRQIPGARVVLVGDDPFGTVLAEAMAVGTPVVATRSGGLPEVVEDGVTGRLVSAGDPDGIAAAVLEVFAHRDEMGAAARERAKRFGTDDYVRRVERLISR